MYCSNCGKKGHIYKFCFKPIISFGVICVKYDKNINNIILNNKPFLSNTNIIGIENNLKFLMIRRKHTIGYIDFLRGNYIINDNYTKLRELFERMTKYEIINLNVYTFDILWKNLWNISTINRYKKDYELAEKKFNTLLENNVLYDLLQISSIYDEPEWGFPKGRRDLSETDIDCALREFNEETNFEHNEYELLHLKPHIELYKSSNDVTYKHIYYLGQVLINKPIGIYNNFQKNEISDIQWLSLEEIISKLRYYQVDKKKLIINIYNQLSYYILNNLFFSKQN